MAKLCQVRGLLGVLGGLNVWLPSYLDLAYPMPTMIVDAMGTLIFVALPLENRPSDGIKPIYQSKAEVKTRRLIYGFASIRWTVLERQNRKGQCTEKSLQTMYNIMAPRRSHSILLETDVWIGGASGANNLPSPP